MKLVPPCLPLLALLTTGCPYQSHGVGESGTPVATDGGSLRRVGPDGPEYTEHPNAAVQATIAAWRERYFVQGDVSSPDRPACIDDFARLAVISAEGEEFRRLCMRCDPDDSTPECDALGRADSCAPVASRREEGEFGEPRPLNVVASRFTPGSEAHGWLVIHETIHHLGRCTGDGIDASHDRPHLWCIGDRCDGGDARGSITSRARALASNDGQ